MRQFLTVALALASACIFVACSSRDNQNAAPTTTSITPPLVAPGALDGLLLSPGEINRAMGATGIRLIDTQVQMFNETTTIPDTDCRFSTPAERSVYAGSGWIAVRTQDLHEPGDNSDHEVWQAVVSFPSANSATRFFTESARRWPLCANRPYHYVEAGQPDVVLTLGPITNSNGTLSTTREMRDAWVCQRALTVSNNVAVDVAACPDDPADAAINIAQQIAEKVGLPAS